MANGSASGQRSVGTIVGYIVLAIVVIGAIVLGYYYWKNPGPTTQSSQTMQQTSTTTTTSTTSGSTASGSVSGTDSDVALGISGSISGPASGTTGVTYASAVAQANSRFQFDSSCHAISGLPTQGSVNAKSGSKVLLENHGTTTHQLAIGVKSFAVKGGGFVLTTAPTVTDTAGYLVTCDGKGAGRLYVSP